MAAVAARALKKPVRLFYNRATDTQMCGGREETQAEYELKFDAATGKIDGLKLQMYKNSGCSTDFSFFSLQAALAAINQVYYIPNCDVKGQLARTNCPARTVVRGPGEIEASYIMETIIEHVAQLAGKTPHAIREANFYDMVVCVFCNISCFF
jgi:xanthine dehydrogenase molybdopterin-binding subunit B